MPVDRTEISALGDDLVESEDTNVGEAPDSAEDTFRGGPPGGLTFRDEEDTGEMLAAVETDDVLEDAGPTAESEAPVHAPAKVRVVERVRTAPSLPAPEPPPVAQSRPARAKLPKPSSTPSYNPFAKGDPPKVGVDPAMFPIHRTAPQAYLGQRIILGLVAGLIAIVTIAFIIGGESQEAGAVRRVREERGEIAAVQSANIEARRQAIGEQAKLHPRTAPGGTIDRASHVRPPRKLGLRNRPKVGARRARKPYVFADGKVNQPKSYGDHAEHVAPPGVSPLLIVMATPQAMVFKDGKLFGATPLLVRVKGDEPKFTVTLKTFGYKEKTIDVKPAASGNYEASVVLDKDPAYENLKVVTSEKKVAPPPSPPTPR